MDSQNFYNSIVQFANYIQTESPSIEKIDDNGDSSTFKSDYHLKHYDNSYFKLRKSEAVGISYEKRGENGSFEQRQDIF